MFFLSKLAVVLMSSLNPAQELDEKELVLSEQAAIVEEEEVVVLDELEEGEIVFGEEDAAASEA
jgi:hypothetical protein